MNQVAIVFWSGTGNTEMMANCIADGVREAGGEAVLIAPGEFSAGRLDEFGAVAFGCPSMGVEQLEDGEFDPMFSEVEPSLSGRSLCSAPTVGETASGCGTGAPAVRRRVRICWRKREPSPMMLRGMMSRTPVGSLAAAWLPGEGYTKIISGGDRLESRSPPDVRRQERSGPFLPFEQKSGIDDDQD